MRGERHRADAAAGLGARLVLPGRGGHGQRRPTAASCRTPGSSSPRDARRRLRRARHAALGRAMVAAIRKITPLPIRRVIVSHYHADHVYGLQALKARGRRDLGAIARATPTSRPARRPSASRSGARICFRGSTRRPRSCAPDLWLDGDTDFRQGGLTFRLIWSGGGARARGPDDVRRRGPAAVLPATCCSPAACRSSATPTAQAG